MMQFSLLIHAISMDQRTTLRDIRLAGFSAVELPLSAIPADLSASGQREFRHLISSHELSLNAIHLSFPGKGFMPGGDVDRLLDRTQQLLHTARDLGAKQVVIDLGPLPRVSNALAKKPIDPAHLGLLILPDPPKVEVVSNDPPVDESATSFFDAAMIELGRRCDRMGVATVLRSSLSPVSGLAGAMKRAGCPWFFACCDPSALCVEGIDFHDAFNLIGPHISHVLAVDVIKGEGGRTKPAMIGRGDVPWRQLLSLLRDADYKGLLTIDPTELPDRALASRTGIAQLKAYL
jgi:sugar phosphate isomerase/epimerase